MCIRDSQKHTVCRTGKVNSVGYGKNRWRIDEDPIEMRSNGLNQGLNAMVANEFKRVLT